MSRAPVVLPAARVRRIELLVDRVATRVEWRISKHYTGALDALGSLFVEDCRALTASHLLWAARWSLGAWRKARAEEAAR